MFNIHISIKILLLFIIYYYYLYLIYIIFIKDGSHLIISSIRKLHCKTKLREGLKIIYFYKK